MKPVVISARARAPDARPHLTPMRGPTSVPGGSRRQGERQAALSRWREGPGENAKAYCLHGRRKFAIIERAEADRPDAETQAITNQSPAVVAYYRRNASCLKLSRSHNETKNGP
jgi:hypothetical protein